MQLFSFLMFCHLFLYRFCFSRMCECGYPLKDHRFPEQAMQNAERRGITDWDHRTCSVNNVPTNAFGEIEFVGFGDKVAKVIYTNQ